MGFISVNEYRNRSGVTSGRGGWNAHTGEDLVISHDLASCNKPGTKKRTSLRIRVSSGVLKQARWVIGDRIEMLFDPEAGLGLLRRVSVGGNALCGRSKSSGATLTTSWYEGMPSVFPSAACQNVVVDEEGVLFQLPGDVSFTENKREKDLEVRAKRGPAARSISMV